MRPTRIAIVDDHHLIRKGIISLLQREPGIEVVFEALNGSELIQKLTEYHPDVVLLDINMPVMDGKSSMKVLAEKYPHIKVIIISMYSGDHHISEMMALGARGFLSKTVDPQALVDAIYSVAENGYYFDEHISPELVEKMKLRHHGLFSKLSMGLNRRELGILKLICEEKDAEQISAELGLSSRTVEWHKRNMMKKTNSRSVVGLVKFAALHGILSDPGIKT